MLMFQQLPIGCGLVFSRFRFDLSGHWYNGVAVWYLLSNEPHRRCGTKSYRRGHSNSSKVQNLRKPQRLGSLLNACNIDYHAWTATR